MNNNINRRRKLIQSSRYLLIFGMVCVAFVFIADLTRFFESADINNLYLFKSLISDIKDLAILYGIEMILEDKI
ncbi:MAG: hypothetical protein IJ054_08525 [Lachnospiraceae bacterium]|nr:hypothetical protein [Lachnospiraceae bacterium]MBQ9232603.1 hypothetical protein [Lachnospiraceae bacterium]